MVDQENLLTLAKLMQILREPSVFGMRTFKLVLLDTDFLEDATLTVTHFVTHFTEESRKTHLFFQSANGHSPIKAIIGSEVLFVTTRIPSSLLESL
jgi:hypothetical protein